MGDGLKLSKDKRHRSSSSIGGVVLEGTRSERKLDLRPSIPEVDDQFTLAEARCNDLQEKIDLVKMLKKKKKLKKRSTTRVTEHQTPVENAPFITVRTQPKKKVSQQGARLRRMEELPNPFRGYLDPATVEQHRMIGQVRGYNQSYKNPQQQDQRNQQPLPDQLSSRPRQRPARADGDSMYGPGMQPNVNASLGVACGEDDFNEVYAADNQRFDQRYDDSLRELMFIKSPGLAEFGTSVQTRSPQHIKKITLLRRELMSIKSPELAEFGTSVQTRSPQHIKKITLLRSITGKKRLPEKRQQTNPALQNRRRHVPRDLLPPQEASNRKEFNKTVEAKPWRTNNNRRHQQTTRQSNNAMLSQPEERPVVELFHKIRSAHSTETHKSRESCTGINRRSRDEINEDEVTGNIEDVMPRTDTEDTRRVRHPRKVKYRSRRYELPTVASQMKQAGVRYYYGTANHTNIPFIVSKSTAPSHNIGVNIQQVLNGLKIQQPLSGIPLTIAHHMGLGHIPTCDSKNVPMRPALDNREMNAIRLGRKLLRLPSYKYMSYNRLLNLYREGDGMVPRFLKAISRPHYFYTSMYNLATQREDQDGATSKGNGGNQEAKQSLAEYASLYREYEHVDKCIKEGSFEPELELRREQLTKELTMREEHIRRVVQDFRNGPEVEQSTLRASASTAEDGYRYSTFKLNLRDAQQ